MNAPNVHAARFLGLSFGAFLLAAWPTFAHPGAGIVVDRRGQVFFIDTGAGVWKIDLQGEVGETPRRCLPLDGNRPSGRLDRSRYAPKHGR
jgi:hypothetical protein